MHVEPQAEHRWLHQLVGEWAMTTEAVMAPGQPPEVSSGSETVRSLGGLWTVGDGTLPTPDGAGRSLMTLGYDPVRGKYVGTFVASMMTKLWVYEGDRAGDTLTLMTEGPSFTDPAATVPYRDVVTVVGPDERTLASHVQGPDGAWVRFMLATYKRVG